VKLRLAIRVKRKEAGSGLTYKGLGHGTHTQIPGNQRWCRRFDSGGSESNMKQGRKTLPRGPGVAVRQKKEGRCGLAPGPPAQLGLSAQERRSPRGKPSGPSDWAAAGQASGLASYQAKSQGEERSPTLLIFQLFKRIHFQINFESV
jgi:hypothetical protein